MAPDTSVLIGKLDIAPVTSARVGCEAFDAVIAEETSVLIGKLAIAAVTELETEEISGYTDREEVNTPETSALVGCEAFDAVIAADTSVVIE
jgi:hypothetical protein